MAGKSTRQPGAGLPSPLTVLYQRAGLPAWPLPPVLAGLYAGVAVAMCSYCRSDVLKVRRYDCET
jgi:hypothetical protein